MEMKEETRAEVMFTKQDVRFLEIGIDVSGRRSAKRVVLSKVGAEFEGLGGVKVRLTS